MSVEMASADVIETTEGNDIVASGAEDPAAGCVITMRSDYLRKVSSHTKETAGEKAVRTSELTPERVDAAIAALRSEFEKRRGTEDADQDGYIVKEGGYRVQKGLDFEEVERALRRRGNEDKLLAVCRMFEEGSKPAVLCKDNTGRFCIAETFGQTLPSRANCVYDRAAEESVGSDAHNGNAVDQAAALGVPLMTRDVAANHFTPFDGSGEYCFDWLQATKDDREGGFAPCLYRYVGWARVGLDIARYHGESQGWRGALWVQS
jgi:hypothetical protein